MEGRYILAVLQCAPFLVGILLFVLLLLLYENYHPERMIIRKYDEFTGLVREKSRETEWYARQTDWLQRNGASFHYGQWINPLSFLSLRIVMAAVVLWGIGTWRIGYGVLAGCVAYVLPVLLLLYLNKQDNIKILPEIKLIYHALEIQIRAGVYVSDALAECYGSVRNRRLRKALLDLAGNIVMNADVFEALEDFQRKFDNRYIDTLCITLNQALESGQAVELLADISEQIKDMEMTLLERKKTALDRSVTFYQLAILAAVLGVLLYACVTQIFSEALRM